MGNKSRNAGTKKKQMKVKHVPKLPKMAYQTENTPQAIEALEELIMLSRSANYTDEGLPCGHTMRNHRSHLHNKGHMITIKNKIEI